MPQIILIKDSIDFKIKWRESQLIQDLNQTPKKFMKILKKVIIRLFNNTKRLEQSNADILSKKTSENSKIESFKLQLNQLQNRRIQNENLQQIIRKHQSQQISEEQSKVQSIKKIQPYNILSNQLELLSPSIQFEDKEGGKSVFKTSQTTQNYPFVEKINSFSQEYKKPFVKSRKVSYNLIGQTEEKKQFCMTQQDKSEDTILTNSVNISALVESNFKHQIPPLNLDKLLNRQNNNSKENSFGWKLQQKVSQGNPATFGQPQKNPIRINHHQSTHNIGQNQEKFLKEKEKIKENSQQKQQINNSSSLNKIPVKAVNGMSTAFCNKSNGPNLQSLTQTPIRVSKSVCQPSYIQQYQPYQPSFPLIQNQMSIKNFNIKQQIPTQIQTYKINSNLIQNRSNNILQIVDNLKQIKINKFNNYQQQNGQRSQSVHFVYPPQPQRTKFCFYVK